MILLWLACSGGEPEPDPRLAPLAQALSEYDQGIAVLASDPEAASRHFAAAVEQHPTSPELKLWHAQAEAAAGRPEEAVALASAALALDPNLVEARYNRACWRVATGDLEGAAADIREALLDPRVDPIATAMDPDLAPLREAFPDAFPEARLECTSEMRSDAQFVGSEWTVLVGCTHPKGQPLTLEGPEVPASLQHLRSVQRVDEVGALDRTMLEVTFKVVGEGEGTLGPWSGRSGVDGTAPQGRYRFLAPEGHRTPEPKSQAPWVLPTALLVEPGIAREGDRVLVRSDPGDRVRWEATGVVEYALRDGESLVWVGWAGTTPASSPVQVTRGKETVYSQQP